MQKHKFFTLASTLMLENLPIFLFLTFNKYLWKPSLISASVAKCRSSKD